MSRFKNITIIGAGNVAFHLGNHLIKNNFTINSVYNRSIKNGKQLAQQLGATFIENLTFIPKNTSLVLVCVADDAIASVMECIPAHFKIAYTSGSVKLEDVSTKKQLGVFYPLQTFTKDKPLNLEEVPFFIESNDSQFATELTALAKELSSNVFYASSEQRFHLHISAVMVNNFVNHLYTLANEHLEANELSINHLIPLIKETTSKLNDTPPVKAQTGPAKRNDQAVINKHLQALSGSTKEIYALISSSIQQKHNKHEL